MYSIKSHLQISKHQRNERWSSGTGNHADRRELVPIHFPRVVWRTIIQVRLLVCVENEACTTASFTLSSFIHWIKLLNGSNRRIGKFSLDEMQCAMNWELNETGEEERVW